MDSPLPVTPQTSGQTFNLSNYQAPSAQQELAEHKAALRQILQLMEVFLEYLDASLPQS